MKRINLLIMAGVLLLGIGSLALSAGTVAADSPTNVVCTTIDPGSSDCSATPKNGLSLNQVIGAVVNILSTVVGIAAVIMIIVGGFKYITAAGDSSKITSARNTVVYALVGVVIAALAQVLVKFVLNKATS